MHLVKAEFWNSLLLSLACKGCDSCLWGNSVFWCLLWVLWSLKAMATHFEWFSEIEWFICVPQICIYIIIIKYRPYRKMIRIFEWNKSDGKQDQNTNIVCFTNSWLRKSQHIELCIFSKFKSLKKSEEIKTHCLAALPIF